ncbi:MAG: hypothetical protein LBR23_04660 [Spirochaetaceae bacterium]|jgi:hypothetical protein|nr:hypothetical protein [Spirochaetaceae bacterium]
MTATYELKADELNLDFLNILKKTFRGENLSVTVEERQDTTDYLLGTRANRAALMESLAHYKAGKVYKELTMKELGEMVR